MSAYGNQKAAFAAQRRSVHHKVDLWYRVRLAPHLSRAILQLALFEQNPSKTPTNYSFSVENRLQGEARVTKQQCLQISSQWRPLQRLVPQQLPVSLRPVDYLLPVG